MFNLTNYSFDTGNGEYYSSEFEPDKVNLDEINLQLAKLMKYIQEIESDSD